MWPGLVQSAQTKEAFTELLLDIRIVDSCLGVESLEVSLRGERLVGAALRAQRPRHGPSGDPGLARLVDHEPLLESKLK
jgi:hypothetical protein